MNYYSDVRQSSAVEIATQDPSIPSESHPLGQPSSRHSSTSPAELTSTTTAAPLRDSFLDFWLVRVLPGIADADKEACAAALAAGGFESPEMLVFLREEDLLSLKVAHRRAILQAVAEMRLGKT